MIENINGGFKMKKYIINDKQRFTQILKKKD